MNELTRKECEQACLYLFEHCYESEYNGGERYTFTPSGFHESEIFKQLIEEHFNNLPLKYEELEEGMWVWDSAHETYVKIDDIYEWEDGPTIIAVVFYSNYDNCECDYILFKENRFYRREVIQHD